MDQRGAILISLIVIMVVAAGLGAAMVSLTGTSTVGEAESVLTTQALYNAYTGCGCYNQGFATGSEYTLPNGQTFELVREPAGGVTSVGKAGGASRAVACRLGCLLCHSSSDSSTYYSDEHGNDVPVVYYTGNEPASHLAGGNFWWVKEGKGGDDTKGHNIFLNEDDDYLSMAPGGNPGFSTCGIYPCHSDLTQPFWWGGGGYGTGRSACEGCHFVNLPENPQYYHENNPSGHVTSAPWYRFLAAYAHESGGVTGIEHDKWNYGATVGGTNHNEYLGIPTNKPYIGDKRYPAGLYNLGGTMTGYCCGCHENFHIQDTSFTGASPWLRHPADGVIPNSGEYASAFDAVSGVGTYHPNVPVARPDLTDIPNPGQVRIGTDMVMCLSCHAPHGSPYYKTLRWDYQNSNVSTAIAGCSVCHTAKNSNYVNSAHGDSGYGAHRTSTQYATGNCGHCHEMHASIGGAEPDPDSGGIQSGGGGPNSDEYHFLLFRKSYASQTDTICYDCHGTGESYTTEITNHSYSRNFGGNPTAANYDSTIEAAFGHTDTGSSHYLPDIVTQILDVTNLRTASDDPWQLTGNSDASLNPENPCNACHSPHLAQRSCNLPGAYNPASSAISRPSDHNNLWGDDDDTTPTNERMNKYAYQAPYWYGSTTNHEPANDGTGDGSNLPDYVTFCTDCHNTYNTIQSSNPRLPGYPRNLKQIDWGSSGDKHGQRDSSAKRLRAPYSTNKVLSCLDCHEPHGSTNNIYLLRTEINGVADVSVPDTGDTSWKSLCFDKCHTKKHTIPGCSGCHEHGGTYGSKITF